MEKLKTLPFSILICTSIFSFSHEWRKNYRTWSIQKHNQKQGLPLHVVNASNDLCFSILNELSPNGNVFFSPFGVSMSMSMVYLGVKNTTALEMRKVLGYEKLELSPDNIRSGFKDVMDIMKQNKKEAEDSHNLEVANALLIEKDYDILPDFKHKTVQFYDAAVEKVSFASHPELAKESVNGWAAWKTHNKIKQVLSEPLDPLTKFFLLNAVYFKGTWKTKFDQRWTMPDTFYNEGKIPKTVPMMRQKQKVDYGFVVQLQSHALELPYAGDHIVMLILLPEKRDGLQQLESKLSFELVNEIPKNLRNVSVQVILPRFTLEEDYDMIAIFKDMGLTSLFDPETADLSGITKDKGLHVSKIVHKSIVDVNEEGSEAATITGVAAGVRTGGALHPLFVADHPFIFFIRDVRTNIILFMGRVNNL